MCNSSNDIENSSLYAIDTVCTASSAKKGSLLAELQGDSTTTKFEYLIPSSTRCLPKFGTFLIISALRPFLIQHGLDCFSIYQMFSLSLEARYCIVSVYDRAV